MSAKIQFGFQCLMLFLLLQLQWSIANAAASYPQFKREHQQQANQQKNQQQPMQQSHGQTQAEALHHSQAMQEKDTMQLMMKHSNPPDVSDTFVDPYQMMNELKHESRMSPATTSSPTAASLPWRPNPFLNQANNLQMPISPYGQTPFSVSPYNVASLPFTAFGAPTPMLETPKFFPFLGFPQPLFFPMPLFYPQPPEMVYPMYPTAFEDTMSRVAGGRRPTSHARDSPIYYMRLPPTPYMIMPNFGYTPAGFSSFLPYQPVSAFSGLSPTFNLPLNFLANGKPSGIYQMTSPPTNELQNPYNGINNFNVRPSMPSTPFNGNYGSASYGVTVPGPSQAPLQDSRMTLLKQPFIFNGRPDEMYILQNSFNHMFGGI